MNMRFMQSLPILMLLGLFFPRNPTFFVAMLPYFGWALIIIAALMVIASMTFTVFMLAYGFTKKDNDDAAERDEQAAILHKYTVKKRLGKLLPANA